MIKKATLILVIIILSQTSTTYLNWGPFKLPSLHDIKDKANDLKDKVKTVVEENKEKIHNVIDDIRVTSIKILDNLINSSDIKSAFSKWLNFMGRPYILGSFEFFKRLEIFTKNFFKIKELTKNNEKLKLGLTFRSDLTDEEYKEKYLMKPESIAKIHEKMKAKSEQDEKQDSFEESKAFLMTKTNQVYDWSHLFYYIKEQGGCGSCWIFAAVTALEGMLVKKYNDRTKLSPGSVLDCNFERTSFNGGCNGGTAKWAYDIMKYHGGVPTEESYPYKYSNKFIQGNYKKCKLNTYIKPYALAKTYTSCNQYDSHCNRDYIIGLLANGPVAIAVDASTPEFSYARESTTFENAMCTRMNHEIVLIGYNPHNLYDDSDDTITIRNSYTNWGDALGHTTITYRRKRTQVVAFGYDPVTGSMIQNVVNISEDCNLFDIAAQPDINELERFIN